MATADESSSTWLDDLKELILKKKEESAALKKFQESLHSLGLKKEVAKQSDSKDPVSTDENEDLTLNTQNPNT